MAAAGVAAVHRLVSSGFSPEEVAGWIPLRCFFHALTGWQCPTCGIGRSLVSAAGGRFETSWAYHPLGIPLLAAVAVLALIWIWNGAVFQRAAVRAGGNLKKTCFVLISVYAAWGFGRNFF